MNKVAKIFINMPIKTIAKGYSYIVPDQFSYLDIGWRVCVPFGHQYLEGFVVEIAFVENCDGLKEVVAVIDKSAWFNQEMMDTAKWIASYYLCSLGESMRLFIPGKKSISVDLFYEAIALEENGINCCCIYKYLQANGPLNMNCLKKYFPTYDMEKVLERLLSEGKIKKVYKVRSRVKEKFEKFVMINEFCDKDPSIYLKNKPAQLRLVNLMLTKRKLPRKTLMEFSSSVIHALEKDGFIHVVNERVLRDSYKDYHFQMVKKSLNPSQENAIEQVTAKIYEKKHDTFLLYGVTGSGKTEVYINIVEKIRKLDKQAIILVPEIALASQMIQRFKENFSNDIVVMHSKLSIEERNDAIERLHNKEVGIVIGARSAVFVPLDDLGVIIIDEEHEVSYKQEERPYYHTREVAKMRTFYSNAILLLGSATPSLESYYKAQCSEYKLLSLPKRANNSNLPSVHIVDMRNELAKGKRSILSDDLYALIKKTLENKEQIIILLNRRGHSTFVLCRECGHIIKCNHCDVPMVYHFSGILRCHYCDSVKTVPQECPHCYSRYIKYFGTGTQKLEEELCRLFPNASVLRMDRDTTTKKMAYEKILDDFRKEKYQILLGTQMVAKGHDFKNVTAVAILSIDSTINIPDFRAAERGFQLLTQASGRAGRHGNQGNVIVQTYNPCHYAITHAKEHDFISFYHEEMNFRKILNYPPYNQLLKIIIFDMVEEILIKKAEILARKLHLMMKSVKCNIIGPFSANVVKVKDIYKMNILIKSREMGKIKQLLCENELDKRKDITIDVDPMNSL